MQSDIFKYVVQSIKNKLEEKSEKRFQIVEEISEGKGKNQVKVDVVDIFQSTNDKTGQRIIIDEQQYEVPTQYVMEVSISFKGKDLEETLSVIGLVAAILKENSVYECGEYNWHGNDLNKFFIEPIIRNTFKETNILHLDYRVEVQINSRNGERFTRVEKKVLTSKQMQ